MYLGLAEIPSCLTDVSAGLCRTSGRCLLSSCFPSLFRSRCLLSRALSRSIELALIPFLASYVAVDDAFKY
jgi:hypothetical protein